MKKVFNFMVIGFLLFSTISCEKATEDSSMDSNFAAANFSFLKSTKASNEANEQRSSAYSAAFEITKVDRNKETLNITVSYQEGCGTSKFDLIWNGLVMESYPEMIIVYLRRSSDCGVDLQPTTRVMTVNLTQYLGDSALAQRVKVILCNSSKKANTENSDIPVSSN
jgi:archaellum component FlaF (FlaF/FlaG flagellin family)